MARKKEGKSGVSFYLDDEVYRGIKAYAAVNGMLIGDVLEGAVKEWWKAHPAYKQFAKLAKSKPSPEEEPVEARQEKQAA